MYAEGGREEFSACVKNVSLEAHSGPEIWSRGETESFPFKTRCPGRQRVPKGPGAWGRPEGLGKGVWRELGWTSTRLQVSLHRIPLKQHPKAKHRVCEQADCSCGWSARSWCRGGQERLRLTPSAPAGPRLDAECLRNTKRVLM